MRFFLGVLFIKFGFLLLLFSVTVFYYISEARKEIENMKYPIPDDLIYRELNY